MAEQRDELIAQFNFPDQKEEQSREEQDKLAGSGGNERDHREHDSRGAHIESGAVAEQRRLQLAQGGHGFVEHGKFISDAGANFWRSRNPFTERARERRGGEA